MQKTTILIALLLLATSRSASASLRIEANYSPSANVFDILDEASNWWDGFCDAEFVQYWRSKVGVTPEDEALFKEYQGIRQKYYVDYNKDPDPLKDRNGLFKAAESLSEDPVAEVFYSSKTIEEALGSLSNRLTPSEISFLKKFYDHFRPKYSPLLEESKVYEQVAKGYQKIFSKPEVTRYFTKVTSFYKVQVPMDYRVVFSWWPPIKRTMATPVGKFLVMRYHPVKHLDSLKGGADIVFHEIVHTVSAQQPLEQKQALTREFLNTCAVWEKVGKKRLLEEPLAVVFGEITFLENTGIKPVDWTSDLYNHPWIDVFSRLIHPIASDYLKSKKDITQGFARTSGALCARAQQAAQSLVSSADTPRRALSSDKGKQSDFKPR